MFEIDMSSETIFFTSSDFQILFNPASQYSESVCLFKFPKVAGRYIDGVIEPSDNIQMLSVYYLLPKWFLKTIK